MSATRHDWNRQEVTALFSQPFNDLLFQAQTVHRQHFDANAVQVSTLLSIKTGACPEDCKYCSQSGHYDTGLDKEKLLEIERVLAEAQNAKEKGASRFCMGAAWRSPREKDMPYVLEMVKQVKSLGMETCMTLGMLSGEQALALKDAGLDYYNHNLDTSPEHYGKIITTRTYADRLNTLANVRKTGMTMCSGGIIGLGETADDRLKMLQTLAQIQPHPESVPINILSKVEGTPLAKNDDVPVWDVIRMIAVTRLVMPKSDVRLTAGRVKLDATAQALCFLAGANSIFSSETEFMLTKAVPSPSYDADAALLAALGMTMRAPFVNPHSPRAEELAEQIESRRANAPTFCDRKEAVCAVAA